MNQFDNSKKVIKLALLRKNRLGTLSHSSVSWEEMTKKFSTPKVDKHVTQKQYNLLSPAEQNKLKDVGSFVGGVFKGTKRRSADIRYRTLVVLDCDNITVKQVQKFKKGLSKICDFEFYAYTTRKHTASKPRWRIIFLLKQKIKAKHYNAVARILASKLSDDLNCMDATDEASFSPVQAMYWPSICIDGLFETHHNKGMLVDADSLLKEYGDYEDWRNLPRSNTRALRPPSTGMKLNDPLEKPGIVGAFCRAYSIEEAIEEYLPEIFIDGNSFMGSLRFTYFNSTTANGAVIYDRGKFLYSHHSNDPFREQTLNAFDMVRQHLHGHLDADLPEDTLMSNRPSFLKMIKMLKVDTAVQEELIASSPSNRKREIQFKNLDEEDDLLEEEDCLPLMRKLNMSIMHESRYPAPKLDTDLFGTFWSEYITRVAEQSGSNPDFVATALLTCAAALIGNSRQAQVRPGWSELPILWMMIVGRPSTNKTPALKTILSFLSKIQSDLKPQYLEMLKQWETDKQRSILARKQWEHDSNEEFKQDGVISLMPDEATEPLKPEPPQILVNDTTIEALYRILNFNPKGVLQFRDEIFGWFNGMVRYNNKGSDREAWLELYNGGALSINRVKNNGLPVEISYASASILGGIQPAKLLTALRTDDDGLQARFLYVYPDVIIEKREYNEKLYCRSDRTNEQKAYKSLLMLFNLEMEIDENEKFRPVTIELSDKAKRHFHEWIYQREIEEQYSHEMLLSAYGKANGVVIRLALVIEHLWWSSGELKNPPPIRQITLKAVKAAISLRDHYLKPMQIRAFGHLTKSKEEIYGKVLAKWILDQKPTVVSSMLLTHEYHGTGFSPGDAANANAALDYLEQLGWLIKITPEKKPGRRKQEYTINPEVFTFKEKHNG